MKKGGPEDSGLLFFGVNLRAGFRGLGRKFNATSFIIPLYLIFDGTQQFVQIIGLMDKRKLCLIDGATD